MAAPYLVHIWQWGRREAGKRSLCTTCGANEMPASGALRCRHSFSRLGRAARHVPTRKLEPSSQVRWCTELAVGLSSPLEGQRQTTPGTFSAQRTILRTNQIKASQMLGGGRWHLLAKNTSKGGTSTMASRLFPEPEAASRERDLDNICRVSLVALRHSCAAPRLKTIFVDHLRGRGGARARAGA